MSQDLKDKVAIITGASSGVGKSIAIELGKLGTTVICTARRIEKCRSVAETIINNGGQAYAIKCDVTISTEVHNMVDEVIQKYGKIDILINNAGEGRRCRITEETDENWHRIINISLHGSFYCTRDVLKAVKKSNNKALHVVNIASVAACALGHDEIAYGVAKTAQLKLGMHLKDEMNHLNTEFKKSGHTDGNTFWTHTLCPGGINTPFQQNGPFKDALPYMLRPEDISELTIMVLQNPDKEKDWFEKQTSGADKAYIAEPLWLFDQIPWVMRVWSKHPKYHNQGDRYQRPDWMKE